MTALSARAAVMSAVLAFRSSGASTYDVVHLVLASCRSPILAYVVVGFACSANAVYTGVIV